MKSCSGLSDRSAIKIGSLTKLRHLCIDGTSSISDTTITSIAQGCHCLKFLSASSCARVTDSALGEVMTRCGELRTLYLSCSNISNSTLAKVGFCLSNLAHLDVSDNALISDFSVYEIAQGCKQLESFQSSGCARITDNSLVVLLRNCVRLESIIVSNCGYVSDASIHQMSKSLRNLKRLDITGMR